MTLAPALLPRFCIELLILLRRFFDRFISGFVHRNFIGDG
jgi:hypothetical protein